MVQSKDSESSGYKRVMENPKMKWTIHLLMLFSHWAEILLIWITCSSIFIYQVSPYKETDRLNFVRFASLYHYLTIFYHIMFVIPLLSYYLYLNYHQIPISLKTIMSKYKTDSNARERMNEIHQTFECCGISRKKEWFPLLRFIPGEDIFLPESLFSSQSDNVPWSCCDKKYLKPCEHINL